VIDAPWAMKQPMICGTMWLAMPKGAAKTMSMSLSAAGGDAR
jgi:hypothetical protein